LKKKVFKPWKFFVFALFFFFFFITLLHHEDYSTIQSSTKAFPSPKGKALPKFPSSSPPASQEAFPVAVNADGCGHPAPR
jgi:hypothetical protein